MRVVEKADAAVWFASASRACRGGALLATGDASCSAHRDPDMAIALDGLGEWLRQHVDADQLAAIDAADAMLNQIVADFRHGRTVRGPL
ncbi:MAG TPA: hypothetical protein VHG30_07985 [Microvirga sp.]|nr:hypothetical protein [Microvirga sp.]